MIIETAQSILKNLTQSQRELLEHSHFRYLAFTHLILDDAYASQAEADRQAYPHLLKFDEATKQPIVSAQRTAEFMSAVSGLPFEWCEAWDAHDFYETHGVSLEQAEIDGHV